MSMTFQQFQATKTESTDIGKAIGQPEWFLDDDGNERAADGLVYDGGCYIEKLENGSFHLTLANEQWVDASLEKLERELYQWCLDEELFA